MATATVTLQRSDWYRRPLTLACLAIVLLVALGEWLSPGFASPRQLISQLTIAALLGIVAAGQNLVILGGREGIDLSVGAMISLAAVIAGNLMQGSDAMLLPALAITLAVTFAIGLLNGLGVTLLRIPPLVMTLGMMVVLQGALVVLTRGIPSGNAAPLLRGFVNQSLLFGIPGILLFWLALAIGMTLLLRRTGFGLRIYLIGSNQQAASLNGVTVWRVRALLFALSGLFAGLTGVCLLGYTGSSFIGVGEPYMLPSIIAVVIGGTSLAGGTGGYTGTVAGAIVLVLLQSILTTLNLEAFGRQIIFGLALLLLMLVYGRQKGLRG